MTSTRLVAAGVAILTAALLTGCSNSSTTDGHRADDHHTVAPADLKQTLLMAGDIPAQWKAVPHDTSDDNSDDSAVDAKVATCIGLPKSAVDSGRDSDKDKVYSPDFTLEKSTVSSESKPNDGTFGAALARAVLTSKKSQSCLQSVLKQTLVAELPDGVSLTKLTASFSKPGADEPKNAQYKFDATVAIAGGGQKLTLYLSFVSIQSDSVDATVNLQGFGTPIPASIRSAALTAVSKRVDAA